MGSDAPRAEFVYGIDNGVLWIEDVGVNTRSVTNDMINVLNDIRHETGVDLTSVKVVYKDSNGNWDGVIPHVESHGLVFSNGWYPLNTRNKEEAIRNAK